MTKNPAPNLVETAREKALAGKGWDALTAQLAADALVLAEVMEENPKMLLDVGRVWNISPATGSLKEALESYRSAILEALAAWDLAVPVRKRWASLETMADTALEAEGAGGFAACHLKGRGTNAFIDASRKSAARLQLLAERLFSSGDTTGALRCARASDTALFTAHHARESAAAADPSLAILRTALMLADRATRDLDATGDPALDMASYRLAMDRATLTEEPVPWEDAFFGS